MLLKRLTLLNILTKLRDHDYYILYMHTHRDVDSLLATLTIISLEPSTWAYQWLKKRFKTDVTTTNTLEYLITALICDDMHW